MIGVFLLFGGGWNNEFVKRGVNIDVIILIGKFVFYLISRVLLVYNLVIFGEFIINI